MNNNTHSQFGQTEPTGYQAPPVFTGCQAPPVFTSRQAPPVPPAAFIASPANQQPSTVTSPHFAPPFHTDAPLCNLSAQ